MYTLIILFYIALIGMIGMVMFKRHELKTGRSTIISRLGKGTDHVFQAVYQSVSRTVSYVNKHTFIVVAQWIAYHILKHVRRVYVELKQRALDNPHSRKVIDAVRGRGEVTTHRPSFYLRRIADK